MRGRGEEYRLSFDKITSVEENGHRLVGKCGGEVLRSHVRIRILLSHDWFTSLDFLPTNSFLHTFELYLID